MKTPTAVALCYIKPGSAGQQWDSGLYDLHCPMGAAEQPPERRELKSSSNSCSSPFSLHSFFINCGTRRLTTSLRHQTQIPPTMPTSHQPQLLVPRRVSIQPWTRCRFTSTCRTVSSAAGQADRQTNVC